MTTPQQNIMKKEKKTPNEITFNVMQTKNTSYTLDYNEFVQYYMNNIEYNGVIEDEEFEEICQEVWRLVCKNTDRHDEIELEEADCDDDVDEDYVCDSSHDFVNDIIDEYKKCPRWQKIVEKDEEQKRLHCEAVKQAMLEARSFEEEKKHIMRLEEERKRGEEFRAKQQKIAELTAELEKLRSS
jgi:hypothetical protein